MLRILHITYSDSVGGASRAAYRIYASTKNSRVPVEPSLLVANKSLIDDSIVQYKPSLFLKIVHRIKRKLYMQRRKTFIYERDRYQSTATHSTGMFARCVKIIHEQDIDIVHLHWLGDFTLSIEEIRQIPVPIVVTLHDCWFFSGSEHYPSFLSEHASDCINGYANYSHRTHLNRHTWMRKSIAWAHTDMHLVVTSHWLRKLASKSLLTKSMKIVQIPCPLDTSFWSPIDRASACKALGLNQSSKYLLYGADGGTADYRKGSDLLYSSLQQHPETEFLLRNRYELLVFGQSPTTYNSPPCPIPTRCIGHITEDSVLRALYSLADVMIVPSRQEAFGQTASEAQSCATPVLAFASTGISSVITHKRTGYLVSQFTSQHLLRGLKWLLEDETRLLELSSNSRLQAQRNWEANSIAEKYMDLYQSIVSSQ